MTGCLIDGRSIEARLHSDAMDKMLQFINHFPTDVAIHS